MLMDELSYFKKDEVEDVNFSIYAEFYPVLLK